MLQDAGSYTVSWLCHQVLRSHNVYQQSISINPRSFRQAMQFITWDMIQLNCYSYRTWMLVRHGMGRVIVEHRDLIVYETFQLHGPQTDQF